MVWKVLAGLSILSAASQLAVYVHRVQSHNRLVRAIDGETMAEIVGQLQANQTPLTRQLPRYTAPRTGNA